jgi:hypothetical protein
MDFKPRNSDLLALSGALGDLRDTWVLLSIALKDHIADTPSPARDEIMVEVEQQLSRIRERERGNLD